MANAHSIAPSMTFESGEDFCHASKASITAFTSSAAHSSGDTLSGSGRLADAVLVTVQDQMHFPVVTALAPQGYQILCEKPLATSPDECILAIDAVKRHVNIFGIGHGECAGPLCE